MAKTINRRSALRTMLYIAGGTLILPACFRDSGRASIKLTHLSIKESDEVMLESLVEVLIPADDTPGGKELLLHLFVLKMVDDCHDPESQKQFEDGLKQFATWSQKQLSMPFNDAERNQQTELLTRVEESDDESLIAFFKIMKRRAIQGYMSSSYVMTNLVNYEIAPGRYNGYFPMDN
ncbi:MULTISPECIES: gluconate 2-dehydrogenase subunit 3 family protein [Sphingobacterium]|uniref:Gluconate 2-dehydrogenase subunit 3 family protein n=1 Tax=Sphingobacterium populi TaxID=1812824 RepID=A0ABW5U9X4_9SPHI|nr:gluconate 2-dehydrogenase subunit 3 family protein [Sphingobacterium sp. CFCC 11742]